MTEPGVRTADSLASVLIGIEERIMSGRLEKAAALVQITQALTDVSGVTGAMIAFQLGQHLICCASSGEAPAAGARIDSRSGLYRECLGGGRMVRCDDAANDARVNASAGDAAFGSVILLPLAPAKDNGILAVFSTSHGLGNEHITAFGTAAMLASLIGAGLEPSAQQGLTLDELASPPSILPDSSVRLDESKPASWGTEGISTIPEITLLGDTESPSGKDVHATGSRAPAADEIARVIMQARQFKAANEKPSTLPSGVKPSRRLKPVLLAALLILSSGVLLARFHSLRQEPKSARAARGSSAAVVKFNVTEVAGAPTLDRPNSSGHLGKITGGTLIQRPSPIYPQSAINNRIQGDILAVMAVTDAGVVADIQISGGNPTLAQSTTAALAHWRYRPFEVGGQSVAVKVPVTVSFRLNTAAE